MLDENGNEIFASLQEDLRGGDICETDNGERIGVFFYHKYAYKVWLSLRHKIQIKKNASFQFTKYRFIFPVAFLIMPLAVRL